MNFDNEPKSGFGPAADAVEERMGRIGRRLRDTIRGVVDAVPGQPRRPIELSGALGVNKDLASKTLLATDDLDPLAAAHIMPGPEALRTLLRAARRRKIDKNLVLAAEDAVRDFEDLIRNLVGGRSELDALLGTWLPEARDRFELRTKQASFKAASQLKGVATDYGVRTMIFYPSEDGEHCDALSIIGSIGLRRLRPGINVHLSTGLVGIEPSGFTTSTLAGQALDETGANNLLEPFCTQPLPSIEVQRAGSVAHYVLGGDAFGPQSGVNLFLADVSRQAVDLYRDPSSPRRKAASAEVDTPLKTLLFDVLLHEAVWPKVRPELMLFDTTIHGIVDINDPSRMIDRIDLKESIGFLGHDVGGLRVPEAPRYVDMLRHALASLGWGDDRLRAYRCRIRYPIYGSQIVMVFDPPERVRATTT